MPGIALSTLQMLTHFILILILGSGCCNCLYFTDKETKGIEESSNLPEVTQLVYDGATIQIQNSMALNHNSVSEGMKKVTLKLRNKRKEVVNFLLSIIHLHVLAG